MSGKWDIIVPEASTNLVVNPVAKVASGLTAIGTGTVTRVTTYSYLGPACHRIVAAADNAGGYLTLTACSNAIHYVSMRIHTASDLDAFDISLDNSNWHTMSLLSQEGSWYVYGAQIPAAQANASTALRIQQNGAGAIDLYIGHAQVEAKEYATTPITGDLPGFIGGYTWAGSANGSSSTRSAQERSGGRVRDMLDTYAVRVRWASGIGMPPIAHQAQRRAMLPGMAYYGSRTEPRILDITAVMGTSYNPETIHSVRKDLVDLLKNDAVTGNQPVVLRYRGALSTKPVEFRAVYDTGMGFDVQGGDFDQPTIRMICYDPYAYEVGEASAQLTGYTSIEFTGLAVKSKAGVWSGISVTSGFVYAIAVDRKRRRIYVGGSFTAVGGVTAAKVAMYDGVTWTALGSGMNDTVKGLAVAANGNLYAVGAFTTAGGGGANRVAVWNGSTWAALGTGLNAEAYCCTLDNSGYLYVGGNFTTAGGNTVNYVARWVISAWDNTNSGLSGAVNAIAKTVDGTLYIGGAFTGYAKKGNVSAWTTISGFSAAVTSIAVTTGGLVYLGAYQYNPATGTITDSDALGLAEYAGADQQNKVYGMYFPTGISGTYLRGPASLVLLNSSSWVYLDWAMYMDVLDSLLPITYAIQEGINGEVWFGGNLESSSTSYVGAQNTITNNSTARAYPVFTFIRSGGDAANLYLVKNETNGSAVYLSYNIQDGEELTLDFRPGKRAATSSLYGSVWRAVLRGSDYGGFHLSPGPNVITLFLVTDGSPTMTQYMTWTVAHEGADGVAA